jgi:Fe-S oxidoreductase
VGSHFSGLVGHLVDFAGIFVMGSVFWAAGRRFIIRPSRIEPSMDAALVLSWICLLMTVHFLQEGFEVILNQSHFGRPFVGSLIANVIGSAGIKESSQATAAHILFWLHIGLVLGFMNYIPYSKHLHLLASPFNVFFHSHHSTGKLTKIDFGVLEKKATLLTGAGKVFDLTWKQLLDGYACTECGRCQENCPAHLTGKPLSPWKVIKDIRNHLLKLSGKNTPGDVELVENVIASDAIWSCTSCLACQEICPVLNEHFTTIMEMRRNQVLEHAQFPVELRKIFRNTEIYGDPLGMGKARRLDWARGLGDLQAEEGKSYDYLIFVGCGVAFFDRNQEAAKILYQLLTENGYSVGILGKEEICCGEPIRKAGNEFLFQKLVRKNIALFQKYTFKKIITVCPHCLNTLKFEYPDFEGKFEVLHHTQLLYTLLAEQKLSLKNQLDKKVVFHDPCYLGRYNSVYDAPRTVIDAIQGVNRVDSDRSKNRSFCCGGGGGRFWMEDRFGQNINKVRLEGLLEKGPEIIVTACPFCASMFEDALSLMEGVSVEVMDIMQLVKQAGGIQS